MIKLPTARLYALRDELRSRGQRPSMMLPSAKPDIVEAVTILEEYGALCEAMFLMMAADRRVLNVEREVLRGALDLLSDGRVRTSHMDAMLDAAARRLADEGLEKRRNTVIASLAEDPARAETTLILAAAVALADGEIVPEEHELFDQFAAGLDLASDRANEILAELTRAQQDQSQAPLE